MDIASIFINPPFTLQFCQLAQLSFILISSHFSKEASLLSDTEFSYSVSLASLTWNISTALVYLLWPWVFLKSITSSFFLTTFYIMYATLLLISLLDFRFSFELIFMWCSVLPRGSHKETPAVLLPVTGSVTCAYLDKGDFISSLCDCSFPMKKCNKTKQSCGEFVSLILSVSLSEK